MLLSRLHPLVTEWDPCAGTAMPCIERGTLVIWNGDMLDRRAQRRLIDVLNRPHRIQILSIAPADLFDRVQRGEFLEALYYRLNTVRVQADAPSDI